MLASDSGSLACGPPPPSAASRGLSPVCRHLSVPHMVPLPSTWPRHTGHPLQTLFRGAFACEQLRGCLGGDGEGPPTAHPTASPGSTLWSPVLILLWLPRPLGSPPTRTAPSRWLGYPQPSACALRASPQLKPPPRLSGRCLPPLLSPHLPLFTRAPSHSATCGPPLRDLVEPVKAPLFPLCPSAR